MDDYLAKPFSLPQLMEVLERWLPEHILKKAGSHEAAAVPD